MRQNVFVRFIQLVAVVAIASMALNQPQAAAAAEPIGQCYTQSPDSTGAWRGPYRVSQNRCAALAGARLKAATDVPAHARWGDYVMLVQADGSYQLFEGETPIGQRYWQATRLVADLQADIDSFWHHEFEQREWDYSSPRAVVSYTQRVRTPCGRAPLNNAFYCGRSHSIYYDANLLQRSFERVGDFAAATVIAHEWGHAIQVQLENMPDTHVAIELQADCFAGAYARDAEARGLLEPGDLNEGEVLMFSAGDISGRPTRSARSHGTAKQRQASFARGHENGVGACLA